MGITAEIKALEKSINYYHFLSKALKKSLLAYVSLKSFKCSFTRTFFA